MSIASRTSVPVALPARRSAPLARHSVGSSLRVLPVLSSSWKGVDIRTRGLSSSCKGVHIHPRRLFSSSQSVDLHTRRLCLSCEVIDIHPCRLSSSAAATLSSSVAAILSSSAVATPSSSAAAVRKGIDNHPGSLVSGFDIRVGFGVHRISVPVSAKEEQVGLFLGRSRLVFPVAGSESGACGLSGAGKGERGWERACSKNSSGGKIESEVEAVAEPRVERHEGLRWYSSEVTSLKRGVEGGNKRSQGFEADDKRGDGFGATGDRWEGFEASDKTSVGLEETPVLSTTADLFDLEKQFSFYGAYHSNKVNIVIHELFVWPIYYTSLILWAYTSPLAPLPLLGGTLPFQEYMILNWSFVQAAVYALYYIALDRKAGSLGAALCLGCWIGANAVAQALPWSLSWKIVLASQVTCWFAQIYGHQKFEGRAPALLDNMAQAFLMAPFFVLLEILQTVFGYEPYPGFHERVQKNVGEAIRKYKASQGKKAA